MASLAAVLQGRLWDKSTATRAAGLAVVALGLQTLRWLLRAADPEETPSPTRSPAPRKDVSSISPLYALITDIHPPVLPLQRNSDRILGLQDAI